MILRRKKMSRPPIKAITAIKNYCEKTQCRRCVFGLEYDDALHNYVGCRLLETTPCDWEIADKEEN
jgi:hypothetical protein